MSWGNLLPKIKERCQITFLHLPQLSSFLRLSARTRERPLKPWDGTIQTTLPGVKSRNPQSQPWRRSLISATAKTIRITLPEHQQPLEHLLLLLRLISLLRWAGRRPPLVACRRIISLTLSIWQRSRIALLHLVPSFPILIWQFLIIHHQELLLLFLTSSPALTLHFQIMRNFNVKPQKHIDKLPPQEVVKRLDLGNTSTWPMTKSRERIPVTAAGF